MTTKLLAILLTLILTLVGCENPLGGNLKGLSAIEDGHTPQLNKPGNFSIDSVTTSDSKITLAWNSSARALSYSVKYGTIFGKYTITANCSTSPCSISGLTNGQTYLFMVSAINSAGSTDLSTPAVGIPSNLPSTPTAVTANGANGSVAIAWAAASGPGVITYNILRSTTSGSGYVTIASSLSNLTYTDSTVTNNTTYYYVVTSTNIGGTSPYSNQVTALPLSAPGIPSSFTATAGAASANLNWTASSGFGTITYNILRSTTSGSGYTSIATGVSTNSYTDSTAVNGTTYYYVVSATNGGGTSSSSTQASATPIAIPTITSIVVNASGSLALTFPVSVGATSYNIKYGTATGVYGTTLTGVTSPKTISGLTAGTIYYFKLVAVNATGSVDSAESTATPLASFAITSTDITSSTQITLAWASSAGASSYTVKYGTASGVYGTTFSTSATTPTTVTGLTAGTTYYFMVTAVNANGSINANAETSLAPASVPTVPSTLVATGSNGSVGLTWTASTGTGPITYTVYRSTTTGSGYASIATALATNSYTDNTVTNGTIYYYVVKAINSGGSTANSNEANALPMLPPTAPSSLVPTIGVANVKLDWTVASGLGTITYNVYRSTSSGAGFASIGTASSNTYTDLTAANGTTYYYKITATNAGGTSPDSNEVSAKAIALPTITSIAVNGSGSLAITFPASTGASTYNIKYGTATGVYGTTVTGVTSPTTISSLTPGTIYYFKLVAVNSTGSVDSAESSATPLANFAITSTTIASSTQITLAWGASAGASSYTVKYGTATGVYGTTFSTAATSPTTVTGLTTGTTYYFMVSAVNANGSLNANAESSLAPVAISSIPTTLAASGTNGSVGLTWTASTGTGPITYNVLRSTTSGSGYSSIATAVATNSYTDNTVSNGTTYYYVVTSTNAGGTSANSNEANALPMLPPTAPSSLVPTVGVANVKLDWTVSSGLGTITYNILRSTTSGAGYASIATAVSANTYTDLTATNGTTYYYKITATNAGGTSLDSNEVSATPISIPTISSITVNGSGSLSLVFAGSTGATSYNIKYGTATGVYGTTVTGVTSPRTISGLTAGTTYYFRVVAVNSTGSVDSTESSATPMAAFTISSTTVSGNNQITLAWNASAGAASYTVKYGTATGVYGTTFSSSATSPTIITGLTGGTTYYFMVTAINTYGSINATAESTAQAYTLPSTPTTLAAAVTVASRIDLSWAASTGTSAITYNVLRSTTSGSGYSSIATGLTTPAHNDTTATPGTTYYYVVTATNSAGTTVNSSEVSAKAMSAFTISSAVATSSWNGRVDLTWATSTGATSYTIKYGTATGVYGTTFSTSATSPTTVTGLTGGTTYYFMVTAVNANGSINATAEASAVPTIVSSVAITAPTNVGSTNCSTAITLVPKNASSATISVDQALTVNLSSTGTATFYSDSACSSSITSTSIAAGTSSKSVYYSSSTPGTQTLTATPTSITATTTTTFVLGVVKVASGNYTTCAVLNDGTVKCWGNNSYYQVGDGTNTNRYSPTLVTGITNATDVVVSTAHACALLSDHTIKCWGINSSRQLGINTSAVQTSPVTVLNISTATSISATSGGGYHTCAVLADQTIRCWGYNSNYQLGDGTTTNQGTPVNPGLTGVIGVAAGDIHTCALLSTGSIKCVGYNGSGQLGNGTTTTSSTWVDVTGITTATQIYAFNSTSCAKLADLSFKCWGSSGYGRLGGVGGSTPTTMTFASGATASTISSQGVITCIITTTNTIQCTGGNREGSFGEFTTVSRSSFAAIAGISNVTQINVGNINVCAIISNGTLKCWGGNSTGQLGLGFASTKLTPIQITGIANAEFVSVGAYHTSVLYTDGTGTSVGWDQANQLGRGGTLQNASSHVAISNLSNATVDLSPSGVLHTCAVLTDHTVKCWGYNPFGELGNGSASTQRSAIAVAGITTAIKVVGGSNHTCVLLSSGTIQCFGAGTSGQLGNGASLDSLTPVTVSGITTATDIAAMSQSTCALLSDHTIQCWGVGTNSQLGNSASVTSNVPVTVTGINNAVAIGAGNATAFAVLSTGAIKSWGFAGNGQLGNGTTTTTSTPVNVTGISTAVAVMGSYTSACAILADGTVQCWGENLFGQLGNNATLTSTTPVAVSGLTSVSKLASSMTATTFCAIKTDKTLWCWGANDTAQMGLGASDPDMNIKTVSNIFN